MQCPWLQDPWDRKDRLLAHPWVRGALFSSFGFADAAFLACDWQHDVVVFACTVAVEPWLLIAHAVHAQVPA
jgi:hypothetical protein